VAPLQLPVGLVADGQLGSIKYLVTIALCKKDKQPTATLRTRKEFLPCQGLLWPGGRTIGALRAERQILTSANGTSCSARHELRSRAFLFIVSAECALPTNASLFAIFARILANAPPPHESLRTCFVCATHAHSHFCPQHWLLCHLGLY